MPARTYMIVDPRHDHSLRIPRPDLTVTLGVQNVSFVAQAVDWVPELLYDIVKAAYHHRGLSFVRIVQRCPEWMPKLHDPWLHDPNRVQVLHHARGLALSAGLGRVYRNQREHDPLDLDAARRIASTLDPIPVGILYHDPEVPCYEDFKRSDVLRSASLIRSGLQEQLDKFTVWPTASKTATTDNFAPEAA